MKLSIEKKSGNIVFWSVDAKGLTYNSELSVGEDITLLIIYEGKNYITMSGKKTVGGIINPDKSTKVFGGMSKLDCKIYAFDESSSFKGMWGLGNIAFKDPKTQVEYNAKANGSYDFRIVSLEDFTAYMKVKTEAVLTEDNIKVKIRDEIHGIIRSYLIASLNAKGMSLTRGDTKIGEAIKDSFNKSLKNSGIKLVGARMDFLGSSSEDAETEKRINDARIEVAITKIGNEAARESAEIAAIGGEKTGDNSKVICSKCREENERAAIYCRKCGERL